MRKLLLPIAAIVLSVFASSGLTPAYAQTSRTWVSGAGNDGNDCSRTTPCQTFAGAISKTSAGGEINCLDPGGFGTVTITKAISIICDNVEAGVLVSGTNGIVVNAGANDVVNLSGLDIDGTGTGINGVQVVAAQSVRIANSFIRGFSTNSSNGVLVAPSTGTMQFTMDNVTVSESAGSASGNAITVQPSGGATVNGTFNNVSTINNGSGFRFNGNGGTINANIRNAVGSHNLRAGLSAVGSNQVKILIDNSAFSANASGLIANGSGVQINMTRSAVTQNTTGLSIPSGAISSYGDNEIDNNTSDGSPPTALVHH